MEEIENLTVQGVGMVSHKISTWSFVMSRCMNVLLLVHMHSSFESVRKIAPDVAPDEDITPMEMRKTSVGIQIIQLMTEVFAWQWFVLANGEDLFDHKIKARCAPWKSSLTNIPQTWFMLKHWMNLDLFLHIINVTYDKTIMYCWGILLGLIIGLAHCNIHEDNMDECSRFFGGFRRDMQGTLMRGSKEDLREAWTSQYSRKILSSTGVCLSISV